MRTYAREVISFGVLLLFAFAALMAHSSTPVAVASNGSDAQLLSALTARLSLTPQQQQEIAAVMQRHGETRVAEEATWEKQQLRVSERRKALAADYGEETKQIRLVMTEAQRAQFRAYVSVELPAEHALGVFTKRYGLSDDQQARLRPVLVKFYGKQVDGRGHCVHEATASCEGEDIEAEFEAKLKPILTRAQRTQFEQTPVAFFGTNAWAFHDQPHDMWDSFGARTFERAENSMGRM